jgi:hypothetical protein
MEEEGRGGKGGGQRRREEEEGMGPALTNLGYVSVRIQKFNVEGIGTVVIVDHLYDGVSYQASVLLGRVRGGRGEERRGARRRLCCWGG